MSRIISVDTHEKQEVTTMKKAIAFKPTSAFGGISILDIDQRTMRIEWAYDDMGKLGKVHKSVLYSTVKSGRFYFKVNGRREFLDDYQVIDRR